MERQTCVVPFETAMSDDSPGLRVKIFDNVLVMDVEKDVGRQNCAPMRHQCLIRPIETAQFTKVVGVRLRLTKEEDRERGKTRVDRVTPSVNNARVRQCRMNQ